VSCSRVAVLKTSPDTVVDDYGKLMRLASYTDTVKPDGETVLNIDLSWHHFFPSGSTTPWQLDGVLKTLIGDGFLHRRISACYGIRKGISVKKGEVFNRHVSVLESYDIRVIHLGEGERWIRYEPKTRLRALEKIFPDGIYIPERFSGCAIIHLPTMKTDALSMIAGTMYANFESLLDERSMRAYSALHEALVDAFTIAKELFRGIFTVMDGVFAGEGPGPLSYMPHEKNLILASSDPVALDAVAAAVMGFEPMTIPFIRLAHDAELGTGDIGEIEILGEDISGMHFDFHAGQSGMDTRIRLMEKKLAGTFLAPLSRLLTVLYSDFYWYVGVGEKLIRNAMKGNWGTLFESYRKKIGS